MQHVGPATLALYFSVIVYILIRYGVRNQLTISDHVAEGRQRQLFVAVTIVTNSWLLAYFLLWLLPKFDAHWSAYMSIVVAFLFQLATTFLPRVYAYAEAHDRLAVTSGVAMLFSLVSLAAESSLTNDATNVLLMVIAAMSVVGASLQYRLRPNYVYRQLSYHLLFSFFVVFASYQ